MPLTSVVWQSSSMRFDTAIFDLDGTIMDSAEGIVCSVEYALDKMGVKDYDRRTNYRFIGPPLVDSFMEYYSMTEKDALRAVAYYRERYSVTGIYEARMYDGVRELLSELKKRGVKLYIGSSKPEKYVRMILEKQGVLDLFDFVAGATFDETRNNKEQVLSYLLEQVKIEKKSTVMIGDRYHDIEGAHYVGLPCIAVLYGFGNEAEFKKYGAEFIAADTNEILKIITSEE